MPQAKETFAPAPRIAQQKSTKMHSRKDGIRKITFVSRDLVLSFVFFLELFVVGSAIYSMNPDVQQFGAAQERTQIASRKHLEFVNARFQTLVGTARELAVQPDARKEFLERALAEVRCHLSGQQAHFAAWQREHNRLNTPFNRVTGNAMLKCVAYELDRSNAVMDASQQHVDRIIKMLESRSSDH